jgi:flagellar biosynthesis/type III secretory pathway chaperone
MNNPRSPLDPGLIALNQQLTDFIALLEQEAIALTSGHSEQLAELTARRQIASQQIAEGWRELAAQLGLPAEAGLPALRLRAFSDAAPNQHWLRMEKLAHDAARLNRINGRLIEEQMRRTQTALQILQSASSRNLYGADGRLNDLLNTSRSIDTA